MTSPAQPSRQLTGTRALRVVDHRMGRAQRPAGLAVVRRPRHVGFSGRLHFALCAGDQRAAARACLGVHGPRRLFYHQGLDRPTLASRAACCLQLAAAAALTVAPVLVVRNCAHSQACSSAYQALTGTMMDDGAGG